MSLDAAQVENLQNSLPATDWSKFDQGIAPSEFGRGAYAMDDKLHVRFFTLARIDVAESTSANRPIFKDVHYIEVMVPGDKHNIVVEPVWDHWIQRFPRQWEQFKKGEEQLASGTPLKVAPFLTPALIAQLNMLHIVTIEQLANLPDTAMGFMGAQEYKQAAKRFLEITSGNEALLAKTQDLEAKLTFALTELQRLQQQPPPTEAEVVMGRAEPNVGSKNFGKR